MKKVLLSILSLMLVSLFMLGITVYAAPGDVNNDGEITIFDVLFITKAVVNGTALENSDVNGDGKTNLLDVINAVRIIATGETPEVGEEEKTTADIVVENGTVKEAVSINGEKVSAVVPEGVAVEDGATELTLTVSAMDNANGNITTDETDEVVSYDVHIDGVSEDNTVAIVVDLGAILPAGQNEGNVVLFHVENGVPVTMVQVMSLDELDEHNEFYYYPATGNVYVAMATFSEVTAVADPINPWNGEIDHSWYKKEGTSLTIANADQLASFAQIVGGMAENIDKDNFAGKTVTLSSDINLGDKIFCPIGYYYIADKNSDGNTNDPYSTVYSFKGTFDGAGHTVANFLQRTWDIKGDDPHYDVSKEHYYNDGMGLFGYVVNGTVKNLTVENFSSDGEFTPTGVVAAYAENSTFENIAVFNCNPRVYNTGNGGIIGIAGDDNDTPDNKTITLKNITVDNSNKISALWGSWDVGCGGLIGMYCGRGKVVIDNCNVSAQIDVYNDVCANYQYYQYRYSGMLIGTIDNHVKDEATGATRPDLSNITVSNCTVSFDKWNDYYYCELVDNTLASYTHDHQMSRLVEVASVDVNSKTVKYLDNTTGTVPATGRANYVVAGGGDRSTENATCYHFKDGEVWNHEDGGVETVDGLEVLKEDKQHLYLPFDQLFTGYGWGIKGYPCEFDNVEITDKTDAEYKFVGENRFVSSGLSFKASDIFSVKDGAEINDDAVIVAVSLVKDSKVDVELTKGATWEDTEITLTDAAGTGMVAVTIQDYDMCKPTTIYIQVLDPTKNHIHADGKTHLVYVKQDSKYVLKCEICGTTFEDSAIDEPVVYFNAEPSDNKCEANMETQNANTNDFAFGNSYDYPVASIVEAVSRLKNTGGKVIFLSRFKIYSEGVHNIYSDENQLPEWKEEITFTSYSESGTTATTGFRIEKHGGVIGFNGPTKLEYLVINGATWNVASESASNGGNNSDGRHYKIPVFVANWNDFTVGAGVHGFGASYFVIGNYFRLDKDVPEGFDVVPDGMETLDFGTYDSKGNVTPKTIKVKLNKITEHPIEYVTYTDWNEAATTAYDRVYLGTRNRSSKAITVKNVNIDFVSEGACFNIFYAGNVSNRKGESSNTAIPIIDSQMENFKINATFNGNGKDAYIHHFQTGGLNCSHATAYLDALNVKLNGTAYMKVPDNDKDAATIKSSEMGFFTYNVRDLDVYVSPGSERSGKYYNEVCLKFSTSSSYCSKYTERTETVYLKMGTHSFGWTDSATVAYPQRNLTLYGVEDASNTRVSGELIIECSDEKPCTECTRHGSITAMTSRFNMTQISN